MDIDLDAENLQMGREMRQSCVLLSGCRLGISVEWFNLAKSQSRTVVWAISSWETSIPQFDTSFHCANWARASCISLTQAPSSWSWAAGSPPASAMDFLHRKNSHFQLPAWALLRTGNPNWSDWKAEWFPDSYSSPWQLSQNNRLSSLGFPVTLSPRAGN